MQDAAIRTESACVAFRYLGMKVRNETLVDGSGISDDQLLGATFVLNAPIGAFN